MTFQEFIETYHIKLNNAQNEAVQAVEGAVLLLAVPGSGKTTVLVTRLGYMLYCLGIHPSSILTMTYTVAATHDMRARFCSLFGDEFRDMLAFRTINGVCAKIIQSYERLTGGSAFELLTDEKEIAAILAAIYRDTVLGDFPTESDIRIVRTKITYVKNMMLTESEIKGIDQELNIPFSSIYRKYCAELKARRRMDYDDQMIYAYRILKQYPQVLNEIQEKYSYICVDEAQDTSKIQHTIITMLAKKSGNLFMVGDEDQSIYGFRAAYPEALLDFEKTYPNARILKMEENYRSDGYIVESADRLIQKNTLRHPKTMKATRAKKNELQEIVMNSRTAQYAYLLKVAANCKKETAVLYRDNESAIPLIDILERHSVPYQIRAIDPTFFTHRVVQDISAIIRFALDPYDTDAFMQIYYKLTTYLNKATAMAMVNLCKAGHGSVWDALDLVEGVNGGTRKSCRAVQGQMYKMLSDRANTAIYRIDQLMGYGEYLERNGIKTNKIAILQAIGANEESAEALLVRLSVLSEIVKGRQAPENCKFILSTIHSAKGLEYDTVYLVDVVDGIFPETVITNPALADREALKAYEEDRRLFYVGATRAKNHLKIFTYACDDSSFCEELLQKKQLAAGMVPKSVEVPSAFESFCARFRYGTKLTHRAFGRGFVLSNTEGILLVQFEDGKNRRLALDVLFREKLLIE